MVGLGGLARWATLQHYFGTTLLKGCRPLFYSVFLQILIVIHPSVPNQKKVKLFYMLSYHFFNYNFNNVISFVPRASRRFFKCIFYSQNYIITQLPLILSICSDRLILFIWSFYFLHPPTYLSILAPKNFLGIFLKNLSLSPFLVFRCQVQIYREGKLTFNKLRLPL